MKSKELQIAPKILPELDQEFRPAVLANRAFSAAAEKSGHAVPVAIALERSNGLVHTIKTKVFSEDTKYKEDNFFYIERLVKTLLWQVGGWKVVIGGPEYIYEHIKNAYCKGGSREFDAIFMGKVFEKPFAVEHTAYENIPSANEETKPVGRHLDGCRIGFDAGGSDRKVSAVMDGEAVYSEEVIWHPKVNGDPEYHYNEILAAMKTAASKMPRVDAIGVSSAGIYVDNRIMAASLFLKVPPDLFDAKVKNMFLDIAKEMGDIPIEVANDGDVTALAGAMELGVGKVLGLAMGTSEAGGYIDGKGNITGWLNELAFIPVDYNPGAMVDEWSGDYGCGVKYFSQDAVIKLAPAAGINLDAGLTPAEKLKIVQELNENGHPGAEKIFRSIGCYLGYALAHYSDFYDIDHVLILGRVTSGKGGSLILEVAEKVLETEFPAVKLQLHLPDEAARRVGQSIAAASLPKI